jgi:hypothetical protein
MNFTDVHCEGHSGEQAPEELAARHAETLLHSNEQRRDYVETSDGSIMFVRTADAVTHANGI